MSIKNSIRTCLMTSLVLALMASLAAPGYAEVFDNPELVKNIKSRPSRGLDEDYTELLYLKTTDYGATWSSLQVAGAAGTFNPITTSLPDFSACITSTNELCYVATCNDAETPGIYAFVGPNFNPVLVLATGDNTWDTGFSGTGHTDVGRTPNGNLFALIWGHDSGGANTFWAAKSQNNGQTWSPWVIATEPSLDASAEFPHISDMNSADYIFILFQDEGEDGYDQHVMRVSTSGTAAGTVTSLNDYSAVYYSYYGGNCKPIAYDSDANALYVCFRNTDASGTAVYYSGDMGVTFSGATIAGGQRYPMVALNAAAQTPWVFSNDGASEPGEHCAWYSYDEFGYNGGSWTSPTEFACTPYDGGDYWLFYMNQGYWWDADRGCASLNRWGDFTPDGINATYTTDGGANWADDVAIFHYDPDQIDAGTVQNCELVGGTDGVAYIVTCGMHGITDITEPTVTGQTLDPSTPADQPGPWVIKAYLDDNIQIDYPDWVQLEYKCNLVYDGTWLGYWGHEGGGVDSCDGCDQNERYAGWYYFTLPTVYDNGSDPVYTWADDDTVWFHVWATDPPGNSGYGPDQAIVVGSEFLGVDDPGNPGVAYKFELLGNYPNPFNPVTRIEFSIPADLRVDLKVYNTLGQEVATLADNMMLARGLYGFTFDASNLSSGVYIYRLSAGSYSASSKMVLIK